MTTEPKKLKCFVISPFGEPNSDIRREADWVLKEMIEPVLQDTYVVERADGFDAGHMITNKMIYAIRHADLIVAVMTGYNPNAFYELAVAHAYERPVIPLIEMGSKIPFDVGMMGTIYYSRADVDVWNNAKKALKKAAEGTRARGYKVENPITLSLGSEKASASASTTDQMVGNLNNEVSQIKALLEQMKVRNIPIGLPPQPDSSFVNGPTFSSAFMNYLAHSSDADLAVVRRRLRNLSSDSASVSKSDEGKPPK